LKIHVERTEEKRQKGHSEFHYGRLMRSMTLPPGVMEGSAAAKYADGILEISFKLDKPIESGRRIAIEVPEGKGGKVRE
jgi:HSP20 family protein